jgi:hypothetical protein
VFEPTELRLHLAFGKLPATKGEYREIDLKPLFKTADDKGSGAKSD